MRYEDASQTGSGQVDARNDADQLAARDYGTASGNVITGIGTISGSAGLDMVDAGQGRITAIEGAGGSDSSFSGGKLSVQGQYGTLTIDARGNYSYDREAGTPEGVTDTFHYTLADKSGATDSARLVISFGEQPKLADATRVVPGPDGVVTLPPGVELSDIRVVGRDLVVTLPDGSLMVIVDGAIFVPQLVLGGVEVPATNLAALLIGSEPRPAAGDLVGPTNPSSGGNFEVPVAPLDPGVPLGDLLPPTELDYTPPEFEELGDILEDNDPPVIGTSAVNVSEEGVVSVAAPNPDDVGSPDTTNSPSNSGVLPVSDPDGDSLNVILGTPSEALTSAGVTITWSVSADGHTLTGSAGGNTVVTVVINDVGAYTVTLLRPVDHPTGGGEQGASFVVPVSVSDGEEVTTGGVITVTIEDDSPSIAGRVGEPILTVDDGTLGVNDTDNFAGAFLASFGADGPAAANSISYALGVTAGPSGIVDVATGEQVNLVMNGAVVEGRTATTNQLVFTVTVDGSGNVTLDQLRAVQHNDPADPVETGASAATLASDSLVTLRIVVTDRDGDTASISVNIGQNLRFEDDGPSVSGTLNANGAVTVDESGPTGASTIVVAAGEGDDLDVPGTGPIGRSVGGAALVTATAAFGADGALLPSGSLSYALALGTTDTPLTLTDGSTITLALIGGVVVGVVDNGPNAGLAAFAIAINPATGVATVELYLSLDHPVNPNPNDPLGLGPNTVSVVVTATDGDGDIANSAPIDVSGQFTFLDDGPSVSGTLNANGAVTVDESGPTGASTIVVAAGEGDDLDVPGTGPIGRSVGGAALVTPTAAFGADGALLPSGSLSYALALGTTDTPLTLTDGSTITLALIGGVVVGVVDNGPNAGLAAFAIAINPATGVATVELYLSLDHPVNPNPNDPLGLGPNTVSVVVTATDGDGDIANSAPIDVSGQFTFLDDGPSVSGTLNANGAVTVDESGPTGASTIVVAAGEGDDLDVPGTGPIGRSVGGAALVTATAAFGADGALLPSGSLSYALALGTTDTPLTLTDGSTITLALIGGVVVGVVDNGPNAGLAAFAIAINPATGVATVELYLSLDHPVNPNPNDPLGLGPNTVSVVVTATDGDGDIANSAPIDVSGQFTFLDDGPSVSGTLNANGAVTVDESGPTGASTIVVAAGEGDDLDVPGTGPIGRSVGGAALVTPTAAFGADGALLPSGSLSYALALGTTDTPLTLTDGSTITLALIGGVVVGVVDNGPNAGLAAFAIAINPATGVATVELYLSLDHPVNPNPNDPLGLGPNTVSVVVTATDGDGDIANSAPIDVSGQFTFLDDGPSVSGTLNANGAVTVDESGPTGASTIVVAAGEGDDLDVPGTGPIGRSVGGAALVTATAAFGADGALLPSGSLSYALALGTTDTPLTLTDGSTITLALIGGVVVGVVDNGPNAGLAAFAIAINPATGVATVELYLSLDHPVNPNPNDPLGLGPNTVSVVVTATDGDGDIANSAPIDVSGQFTFLDDGPSVSGTLNANGAVTVDESGPTGASTIVVAAGEGDDLDVPGTGPIGRSVGGAALVTATAAFGADGALLPSGSLSYALALGTTDTPLTLTDGSTITLALIGGVVVGVVDNGPNAGLAAFAIAINPATGVATVELYLSLDHPVNPNPNDPLGLGPNTVSVVVTATDGDGDIANSAPIDVSGQFTFLDDGPSVSGTLNANGAVTVDESGPTGASTIVVAAGEGDDLDVPGTGPIGRSVGGAALVTATAAFGADGALLPSGSLSYALALGTTDTPLTLTDGSTITLALIGGVVVGVVDNGPNAGLAAFAIAINPATGVATVELYLSLDHPVNPNPNDPLGLGPNTVSVVVTATDGDGDIANSAPIDVSGQFTFLDDGPSVSGTLNANGAVTVDESGPTGASTIVVAAGEGDDLDVPGTGPIGRSVGGAALVTPTAAFGADGALLPSGSLSYALALGTTDTPLTLTDGSTITLALIGGVVVGVVDNGPNAGLAAFAIAINPATGVATVELYLSLDHPVNPNPNDPLGLGPNTVSVVVTATDGDGDIANSAPIDVSGQFTFLDDGPSVSGTLNANGAVTVDESGPTGASTIVVAAGEGDDLDVPGTGPIGRSVGGAALVTATAAFGADGALLPSGSLSYALALGTTDTPLTLTDGSTITLALIGGVVVGVVDNGPNAGLAAFAIAINPATGVATVELYLSLDHPVNPNPNDPLGLGPNTVSVVVTATDGDGDIANSAPIDVSGQFTFLDDGPSVSGTLNANGAVTVDESGPTGASTIVVAAGEGDDLDVPGTGPIGRSVGGAALVTATAAFGADGALLPSGSLSYALALGTTDTPLTLTDGSTITLALIGGVVVGVVDNGPNAGLAAFAIAINPATGVATVELYLSLDHPVNPNPNDPLGLGPNTVSVVVTATDGDGDIANSAPIDVSGQFTFLDDGPSVSGTLNANGAVTVDESGPTGASTIVVAAGEGDDLDVPGTGPIGRSVGGAALVTATAAFGADGALLPSGSLSYALALGTTDTPLTLTDGSTITLALIGGVVVGVVDNGPNAGLAAFAIAINPATGVATVELYLSLDHPVNPNPNDPLGLGPNTVSVVVTATDGDGDIANSAPIDVSGQFTFLDDGPSVSGTLNANGAVTVDESGPTGASTIVVAAGEGDDLDVPGTGPIGRSVGGAALVTATAAFGADGALLPSGSLSYALALGTTDTPLTLTDGSTITLALIGGVVVGVVDNGPNAGLAAFAIAINPATGVATVELYLSLDHPVNPNPNDLLGLGPNTVSVVVTATDGDGDFVNSAPIDVSGQFNFLDDGPVTIQPDAIVTGTINNEVGATATADLDDDGEVLTDFRADGPGLVTFANIANGDDSGYTSSDDMITYWLSDNGQTLQGRTNSTDGTDGTLIFTVAINQAAGDYTITMAGTIDNGAGVSFDDLTSGAAGNVNYRAIGANDPATTVDIILSASLTAGGATSVNTDSDSIGAANQSMDSGETVRIDFVTNLQTSAVTAGTPMGLTHGGHVSTNSYIQTIPQVQGNQPNEVAFQVWALDTNDTQANEPDRSPLGGFANSDIVTVTEVTVISFDNATPITTDISAILVGTWTAVGYGISVQKQADGSVIFTGVQQGDQYGISTGVNDFNAIAVQAEPTGTGPVGNQSDEDSFDLGVFAIGSVDTGDPITLTYDLAITDGDGDSLTMLGAISITLDPAGTPPIVLDLDGDGVEFLSQSAGVAYDYGNGLVATAWAGADDGILVRDANGNGLVDDASEFVFGGNGQTDMEALHAQYGDQLDASDADFVMFAVWNDANSNGIADDGELSSLAEAGIASIGLVSDGIAYTAANGDVSVAGSSSFTRTDGSTGTAADAVFRTGSRVAVEADRVAANSNNVVLAAAVAAAGLAASAPSAAAIDPNGAASAKSANATQVADAIDLSAFGLATDTSVTALMAGMGGSFDAVEIAFQSGSAFNFANASIGELAGGGLDASAPMSLAQGSDLVSSPMAMPMMASNVAMPSAEALVAMAGLDAGKSAVSVEAIVANALQGGGGPDIDALLSALPSQGIGANAGLDALASLGNGTVPSWDMGHGAGFTFAGPNAITTEALVLHHDAIQPIANG